MALYHFYTTEQKAIFGQGVFKIDDSPSAPGGEFTAADVKGFFYKDREVKTFSQSDLREFSFVKDRFFSFRAEGHGCNITTDWAQPGEPGNVTTHGCDGDWDTGLKVTFPHIHGEE